ncbi:EF-P beta-lysylation protein EpmB [Guyparkeria sp. SCN-R1]|uniref:EF-P beta-lysylation protein EpmB n=1 Tax=Guyparkeria sp. SCN-R1 TaxID=2341113 RepID=UPI000F655097|nr:EF-P beta-lysylation protein EpmB [Guyparkeria sp. SCN-R1]RRQ24213.1 EF-P beta-lysylation protein EpmB [Guyparkeria sp. SCN-R1]
MAAIIPDNPSSSQPAARPRQDADFVELTTPLVESQIDFADPDDPVARQFRVDPREALEVPGFDADPVGDLAANAVPGVLHKYRGRALLVLTGACAVHCRYCFRRHFPYGDQRLDEDALEQALDYLATDPEMTEVILSGGDPLVLSSRRLATVIERLAALPHLRRLRIHSRIPTVSPERIDESLCQMLAAFPAQVVLVAHVNHPRELGSQSAAAFGRLREAGVTLLNQTVLLEGVNNDTDVLAELSEALFEQGVLPYYLHQLDPVAGAAHFAVDVEVGRERIEALRARLPGYLVPRFVVEQAGEPSKTPIS